ncbi:MAG: orotate phosphoribosyltransferase [Pseudomonadota bacterium]
MADQDFISFLLDQGVLQFGEFTLNSGRQSPYFFNLGSVNSGMGFARLGQAYADTIVEAGVEFDVLFGPAYKGIPIAVATAVALAAHGKEVNVAYNRKEAKDHGEGGRLVGAQVTGRVLLIDDVLTSGKAIRDAVGLIEQTDAQIVGAVIAMDRQERNDTGGTAVQGLAEELQAPVISIANMQALIEYLSNGTASVQENLTKMRAYQTEYCVV